MSWGAESEGSLREARRTRRAVLNATLLLRPPSPAPTENLGAPVVRPAGGGGVWEGSQAHTRRTLLCTSITLEKILHRWEHPAALGVGKASLMHLSLEE